MKKRAIGPVISASLAMLFVSAACLQAGAIATQVGVAQSAASEATLVPATTPAPTATATPTDTEVPTPAPIGATVTSGSLEITVLDAVSRPTMHLGDIQGNHYVYYYAKTGQRFIDIVVLVRNLDSSHPTQVKWNEMGVAEENGDSWYPVWAKTKISATNDIADPYSIGISSAEVKGDETLEFRDYTYLRLVFLVKKDPAQTILFGIGDSPLIAFKVK